MRKHSPIDDPWWRLRYGPAWRYLTARDYQGHLGKTRVADPLTKEVARYLRVLELGGEYVAAAPRAFPKIARAFRLQRMQPLVDDLRLMLLGGLDEVEILRGPVSRQRIFAAGNESFVTSSFRTTNSAGTTPTSLAAKSKRGIFTWLAASTWLGAVVPRWSAAVLDGPGMVPSDPDEYARYVRTEAQLASAGLFLSPPESREEMETMMNLALQMAQVAAKRELAEKQLAAGVAKDNRRHELDERRARAAELAAETAAVKAATKVQAQADEEAQDRDLKSWHREQQAAMESRLLAEREARIEQSPFQQLQWADPQESGSPQVAPAAVPPDSPASPPPSRRKKRPSGQRPSTSASLRRVIAEAVDPQPAVAEPASTLAP